jgi:hypothetical protein
MNGKLSMTSNLLRFVLSHVEGRGEGFLAIWQNFNSSRWRKRAARDSYAYGKNLLSRGT